MLMIKLDNYRMCDRIDRFLTAKGCLLSEHEARTFAQSCKLNMLFRQESIPNIRARDNDSNCHGSDCTLVIETSILVDKQGMSLRQCSVRKNIKVKIS